MKWLMLLTLAFAQTSPWTLVREDLESANTSAEFAGLKRKYPKYFAAYDPAKVASASIDLRIYRYSLPSHCPPGDPKLTFESASIAVCDMAGANSLCSSTAGAMPPLHDPCLH